MNHNAEKLQNGAQRQSSGCAKIIMASPLDDNSMSLIEESLNEDANYTGLQGHSVFEPDWPFLSASTVMIVLTKTLGIERQADRHHKACPATDAVFLLTSHTLDSVQASRLPSLSISSVLQ